MPMPCNDNGKIFGQCKIDFVIVTWCNSLLHDVLG